MNAEQLARIAVEQQLQHPGLITDYLSPSDFSIACFADLVRYSGRRQFLFGAAYERDFGHGIDAIREEFDAALKFRAESVRDRHPALFHRSHCKRRKADYVAGRVNVRNFGLKDFVNADPTAIVGLDPRRF